MVVEILAPEMTSEMSGTNTKRKGVATAAPFWENGGRNEQQGFFFGRADRGDRDHGDPCGGCRARLHGVY